MRRNILLLTVLLPLLSLTSCSDNKPDKEAVKDVNCCKYVTDSVYSPFSQNYIDTLTDMLTSVDYKKSKQDKIYVFDYKMIAGFTKLSEDTKTTIYGWYKFPFSEDYLYCVKESGYIDLCIVGEKKNVFYSSVSPIDYNAFETATKSEESHVLKGFGYGCIGIMNLHYSYIYDSTDYLKYNDAEESIVTTKRKTPLSEYVKYSDELSCE